MVSSSCHGCTSAALWPRMSSSCILGEYFIVQVPSLMSLPKSMPSVICAYRR